MLAQEKEELLAHGQPFSKFYGLLRSTQEYHARFPQKQRENDRDEDVDATLVAWFDGPREASFSSEEVFGKYLDLRRFHARWRSLSPAAPEEHGTDYQSYLKALPGHLERVEDARRDGRYRAYVRDLDAYLCDFFRRTQPLLVLEELLRDRIEELFEASKEGAAPGSTSGPDPGRSTAEGVELERYSSAKELEPLGMETLKRFLADRGLKCGGTLEQRAQRLFSVKGVDPEEVPRKLRAKGAKTLDGSAAGLQADAGGRRALALLEHRIRATLEGPVSDAFENTIRDYEKRAGQTPEERIAELANEESGDVSVIGASPGIAAADPSIDARRPVEGEGSWSDGAGGASNFDVSTSNGGKKLPLGWDGKPIPHWLYKLHGLGKDFKCEICGNFTYHGQRQFEQHFQEARHAHGMRCLGIPNTTHFRNITSIADAKALHRKMLEDADATRREDGNGEEFEDDDGNVFDKQTFEDLRKLQML